MHQIKNHCISLFLKLLHTFLEPSLKPQDIINACRIAFNIPVAVDLLRKQKKFKSFLHVVQHLKTFYVNCLQQTLFMK
jgi:hypothetical protein